MKDLAVSKCGQVHHEVRNGIQCVLGHLSVLRGNVPGELMPNIDAIDKQVNRMSSALDGCHKED